MSYGELTCNDIRCITAYNQEMADEEQAWLESQTH